VALARRRSFAIARWREEHWRSRARLDLSGAYLSGAKLPGADLAHDDLGGVDLTSADLHGANLSGTNLEAAHLSRANLSRARLPGANLKGVSLVRANLKGSNLQGVDLSEADLSYADLSLTDLSRANLAHADLTGADLSQSDLSGACLCQAVMTTTNLDIANLDRADLRRAALVRASLDGTLLSHVRLEMTLFGDCDLSRVLGLASAQHSGPSIVGLDTLVRSGGSLSPDFLRQAGLPPVLAGLQDQLGQGSSRHPRVLLVGSIKDAGFIGRLLGDLRGLGLACWTQPVDDEEALLSDGVFPPAQRLAYYDQMVLVCSQHSLESPFGWRFFEQVTLPSSSSYSMGAHRRPVFVLSLDTNLRHKPGQLCDGLGGSPGVDFSGWEQDPAYRQGLDTLVGMLRGGGSTGQSSTPSAPRALR
jgi:uncharacterized protein YjbI with pentapeptide repeats